MVDFGSVKKYIAEFIGTTVLVAFGCGTAAGTGVDTTATSLAFGLSIVAMAYSVGNVSGCHVNPAVSLAMLITKKLNVIDFIFYVLAQCLGGLVGAMLVAMYFGSWNSLGGNKVQDRVIYDSDGERYIVALVAEIFFTFVFVYTILGVTSKSEYSNVAGIVIGLTLTLIHLCGIQVTGTSVNPARSLGPALFQMAGEKPIIGRDERYDAIEQIWIFILGPLVGSALAAVAFMFLGTASAATSK